MTCKDCQNENQFPDRTIDQNCTPLDINLENKDVLGIGPSLPTGYDGFGYIKNLVRDLSVRFGKIKPGIIFEEQDAADLGLEITEIFDDIEDALVRANQQLESRKEEISNEIQAKLKDYSCDDSGCGSCDFEKPCNSVWDAVNLKTPAILDHINPIAFSTLIKVGTCRINLGCSFCDFPGDLNIPAFPGIPTCSFVPVKSCLCGFDYIDPFATVRNAISGMQMFTTQLGQFAYSFFDIFNVLNGFLTRCIIRIMNCVGIWMGDFDFGKSIALLGAKVREQIGTSIAIVNGSLAKINAVVNLIESLIMSIVAAIYLFIDLLLELCDPCKLVAVLLNPASFAEIVSC